MSSISQKLEKEHCIKSIEGRLNAPLADLFYQMHWGENLMHRQVAQRVGVPRPTVTRWFSELRVPSQPSERITKTYLTSWLYKTGKLKPKPRYEGPDRRLQETRNGVNVNFFKRWSPEMAYVLGYYAADGCLAVNPLGARYIHFDSIDKDLLETVRTLLGCKQVVSVKRQGKEHRHACYRLQIGSRQMFSDLARLGFGMRKGRRIRLPKIPASFLADFVRGYFDGDGGVSYGAYGRRSRPGKARCILARFTSESIGFLKSMRGRLRKRGGLGQGSLIRYGTYACLSYGLNDSRRLFRFMYGHTGDFRRPFLVRKHVKFLAGLQFCAPGAVA